MSARLPDLSGMVRGIVGCETVGKRTVYTLQCERCYATEKPWPLCTMTFHFHTRSPQDQNPRLCRACRVEVLADCKCLNCEDDRREHRRLSA